ncbi:hypothetical protein EBAPG3_014015 [Nitrosospira lacus]|uniref:DUF5666 domain-containing protein n=2 Tax=Nitrosospira lacus TaxID=1288494 RepID=A0A1W6SSM8_9PROT|nr:hypothetical protein EBAPG3_014015 [Nitrosospira lacus]
MNRLAHTFVQHASICASGIAVLTMMYSGQANATNMCNAGGSPVNPVVVAKTGKKDAGPPVATSGIGGRGALAKSGVGGTGAVTDRSGMGGTGIKEGGIGGTGQMVNDGGIGGTGIIGVITGFASVCVNGVEIQYDATTPVSVDGRPSTAHDLAVGQVIVVRAHGVGTEVTARNIAVVHAVVGPISSVNAASGELHVLGQTVHAKEHGNLANFKTGDWVRVSGHRLANGDVTASRIEPSQQLAEARINGHVTQVDANGFVVDGARVNLDKQSLPTSIARGAEVSVSGHWDGTSLRAHHVQVEPSRDSMGRVEHIVIEGYVHASHGRELDLGIRKVTLDSNLQILGGSADDLKPNQHIQVSGRVGEDQRVTVDRVEVRHERPDQGEERRDRSLRSSNDGRVRDDSKKESERESGRDRSSDSDSRSSGSSGSSRHESEQRSGTEQRSERSDSSGSQGSSGREPIERPSDFQPSGGSRDHDGHHGGHLDR